MKPGSDFLSDATWRSIASNLPGMSNPHLEIARVVITDTLQQYKGWYQPRRDQRAALNATERAVETLRAELRKKDILRSLLMASIIQDGADPDESRQWSDTVWPPARKKIALLTSSLEAHLAEMTKLLVIATRQQPPKTSGRGGARENSAYREKWLLAQLYAYFAEFQAVYPHQLKRQRWAQEYREPFAAACLQAACAINKRAGKAGKDTREAALKLSRAKPRFDMIRSVADYSPEWPVR